MFRLFLFPHVILNAIITATILLLIADLGRQEHVKQLQDDDTALRAKQTTNNFEKLLKRAYQQTGQQVVILVDKYDKPLLQTMGVNEVLNEDYRNTLKAFYSCGGFNNPTQASGLLIY